MELYELLWICNSDPDIIIQSQNWDFTVLPPQLNKTEIFNGKKSEVPLSILKKEVMTFIIEDGLFIINVEDNN